MPPADAVPDDEDEAEDVADVLLLSDVLSEALAVPLSLAGGGGGGGGRLASACFSALLSSSSEIDPSSSLSRLLNSDEASVDDWPAEVRAEVSSSVLMPPLLSLSRLD